MSSSRYSVCLDPDPALRRLVASSSYAFLGLGLLLIARIPEAPVYLCTGAVLWIALFVVQLIRARRGWRRIDEVRVSQGPVFEVRCGNNDWAAAEPLSGTLLIGSFAWFRLKTDDQIICVEPLRASGHRCNKWRRLQVIWRHVGAS